MELEALECLVVLAEERHYGRAAGRLQQSPAAVTRLIQHLERRLGASLVIRSHGDVVLTPVGDRVLASARAILVEQCADPRASARHRTFVAEPIRVGVSYTAPPMFQRALRAHLERFVGALRHIVMVPATSSRVIEQIRAGDLDLGAVHAPAATAGLAMWHLHTYEWQVALPAGIPWPANTP